MSEKSEKSEKSEINKIGGFSELGELGKSVHVYITDEIVETAKTNVFLIETGKLPVHINISIIGTATVTSLLTKKPIVTKKGTLMASNTIDDPDETKATVKVYSESTAVGTIPWISTLLTDPLSVCQDEVMLKPNADYLLTMQPAGTSPTVGKALVRFKWVEKDI